MSQRVENIASQQRNNQKASRQEQQYRVKRFLQKYKTQICKKQLCVINPGKINYGIQSIHSHQYVEQPLLSKSSSNVNMELPKSTNMQTPNIMQKFNLACQFYHNFDDKRRPVYKMTSQASGKNFSYQDKFVVGCRKDSYCINYVEYLFHPMVYKTMMCKSQTCQIIASQQKEQSALNWEYQCPYYHNQKDRRVIDRRLNNQSHKDQKLQIELKALHDIYLTNQVRQIKDQNQIGYVRKQLQKLIINRNQYQAEQKLKKKQNKKVVYQQKKNESQKQKSRTFQNESSHSLAIKINQSNQSYQSNSTTFQNSENSMTPSGNKLVQFLHKQKYQQAQIKQNQKGNRNGKQTSYLNKSATSFTNQSNKSMKLQTVVEQDNRKRIQKANQFVIQNIQNSSTASKEVLINQNSRQNPNPVQNSLRNQPFFQNYFAYGQKVNIIQDRHHQFKIFRDFDINQLVGLILKYITGFMNSEGGFLYLGIDDYSVVYGINIHQKQFDKILIGVDSDGRNRTVPPLMPQKYQIKRIPVYTNNNNKLYVIGVKISKSTDKQVLTTYNRQCFMRMNASTIKLNILDFLQYQRMNLINVNQLDLTEQDLKKLDKEDLEILKGKVQIMRTRIQKVINRRSVMNNS